MPEPVRRRWHLKLHLIWFCTLAIAVLYLLHRKYRLDEPWLAPAPRGKIVLAIRIDTFIHNDEPFPAVQEASLAPFMPTPGVRPYDRSFKREDMSSGSRLMGTQYSWVRVTCSGKQLDEIMEDAKAYDRDLATAFAKTGFSVKWQLAVINEQGEIYRPR